MKVPRAGVILIERELCPVARRRSWKSDKTLDTHNPGKSKSQGSKSGTENGRFGRSQSRKLNNSTSVPKYYFSGISKAWRYPAKLCDKFALSVFPRIFPVLDLRDCDFSQCCPTFEIPFSGIALWKKLYNLAIEFFYATKSYDNW